MRTFTLLVCLSLMVALTGCGSSHAPVTHADLTGKWEVVDVKITSDYIDANPKFKKSLIESLMGTTYVFSDEKFLTITYTNAEDYGEYRLEDAGHTLSHNAGSEGTGEASGEIYLEDGNLSIASGFGDVDGSSSDIALVLRSR